MKGEYFQQILCFLNLRVIYFLIFIVNFVVVFLIYYHSINNFVIIFNLVIIIIIWCCVFSLASIYSFSYVFLFFYSIFLFLFSLINLVIKFPIAIVPINYFIHNHPSFFIILRNGEFSFRLLLWFWVLKKVF
jgi:hypothetical protein